MPKITPFSDDNGGLGGYMFDCPGCGIGHHVAIEPHQFPNGASWTFSGTEDCPTFAPSVLTTWEWTAEGKPTKICHLFVRNGKLEYLSDCTHQLAGRTVEMPDMED